MAHRANKSTRKPLPTPDPRQAAGAARTQDTGIARRAKSSATGITVALFALAIVLAGTWAYSTSFRGAFVFDDYDALMNNSNIRALWPLTTAMSGPPETPLTGRPIASLSFAVSHAMAPVAVRDVLQPIAPGQPRPSNDRLLEYVWPYHFLNLLIHLAAALALFGVVRHTLMSGRMAATFGGAAAPLAAAVALIWVVHPLQTEAVTYVIQRTESLMGLFYLLTLYCAIRARAQPRRVWWIAAAIASCAMGMATKEVMVTAPLMVVLWDIVFSPAGPTDTAAGRIHASRWPLYIGLAATWAILIAVVSHEHRTLSAGFGLGGWTAWSYLLTQTRVVAHYLRLAVVPTPLIFDPFYTTVQSIRDVAPQAIVLAVLAVLTVAGIVRRHPLGFAGSWFFLILAPTSSILPIPMEIAAEHRMYLPLAAIVAIAVIGAATIGEVFLSRLSRSKTLGANTAIAWAITLAIVVTFAGMTRARNLDYASDESLWRDTVTKQPANPRAHMSYGLDLIAAGRPLDGEAELQTAVNLDATNVRAQVNLGNVEYSLGKFDDAIVHLERALVLEPTYTDVDKTLGIAYARRGRDAAAMAHLRRALSAQPDDQELINQVAWLLATSSDAAVKNAPAALDLAERAVRLTSRQAIGALNTLAAAQAEAGRLTDAIATMTEAIQLAHDQGRDSAIPTLSRRLADYQSRRK